VGQKPLGLYLMEEAVDNGFAAERLDQGNASVQARYLHLFRTSRRRVVCTLPIYDLKTKATPETTTARD
jgi:hypothetical protein